MKTDTLIEQIEGQAKKDAGRGKLNHIYDLTCIIGGIVASFVAAVLVALGDKAEPWKVAAMAGVPGLCAALRQVIDFRARSEWFFIKAAELRGIALGLKHEGLPEAEGARKFRELEIEMEQQWPQVDKGARRKNRPED
jgi:hypothetical protein